MNKSILSAIALAFAFAMPASAQDGLLKKYAQRLSTPRHYVCYRTNEKIKIDGKLNEKERMILQARLLTDEPKTLQTIADEFGISRERVRQIEANLLKKLRRQLEKDLPDIQDFLDGDAIAVATGPAGRDE